MATVAVTSSPVTLDGGTSEFVTVANTGAVDVTVARGSQSFTLRPGQSRTVYPEGSAVTASVVSGSGQVTTSAQAAQVTQAQQVAANTTAIAGLPATYASKRRTLAGRLSARLPQQQLLTPSVHPAPPTFTYGTSRTLTARIVQPISPVVSNLGGAPVFNATNGKTGVDPSAVGIDFWLDGDQCEFSWFCQASNAEAIWVFVDGLPATAAPQAPGGGAIPATTTGTQYYGKLTFASVARRRVTVYAGLINAWGGMGTLVTGSVTSAARLPRIAVVGDSFADYTAGSGNNPIYSFPFLVARSLGCEAIQRGIGSTGYTTAQPFGSPTRVSGVAATNPDAIVIVGSVNDSATGLQAAATACYDAYAAACPTAPIIVVGPQASDATNTISSARQQATAAIKAAATAHSQVIGFYDPCGHADALPAAYSSGTTYNTGDKVTSLGSVWKLNNGTGSISGAAPVASTRWQLLTWGLFGTGKVGSTTADGSRDMLLYSDGVHPTAAGQEVFALNVSQSVLDALLTAASA